MLVTTPPMATSWSGTGRLSMRDRSAAIACNASRSTPVDTTWSSLKRSVYLTAPTSTLKRSSTREPCPKVNCELPPPVSKTTSDPVNAPSPERAPR
jgi:hypothetical protein